MFIVTPIVEVCNRSNCSKFCCTLRYVHSSFAIILMGKRELVALLSLSSWCLVIVSLNIFYCQILYSSGVRSQVLTTLVTTLPLVIVVWLCLAVPCLQFVIVVFPAHTHLLCSIQNCVSYKCKKFHRIKF